MTFRASLATLLLIPTLLSTTALEAQQYSGSASEERVRDLNPEAQVFLGVLEAIRDFGLDAQRDSILWEKAIDGLIKELGDPYASVMSPDQVREFEESSTGNYAGIGIQISELNGEVTITAVFRNTPAERAELQVGDRIVGVDDEPRQGWSVGDASNRIRGQPGTMVVVLVERDGITQPIRHEIRREQVHIPAVRSERLFGDVGYVMLDRVTRNSAAEVDSVLTEMEGVRGMILDLRRNPGGYLDESLNLADLFLDRGSILATTRSRTRAGGGEIREESARARMAPRVPGLPIVVLVDRYSASAAEIVAGALQDHDRALVIGERTFGKGTVQSVLPLPEGRLIRITSGEWYTPQGRSLNRPRDAEGFVIEPDSIPRFTSSGGRVLVGGGGVFPDLEITADNLSETEQAFLSETLDAEIPLSTRIREAAFGAAQRAGVTSTTEELDAGAVVALLDEAQSELEGTLRAAGIAEDTVTEEIREYLAWRLAVEFYERLGRVAQALEAQSTRDTVLATAIGFLQRAESQDDLFALALAGGPIDELISRRDGIPAGH